MANFISIALFILPWVFIVSDKVDPARTPKAMLFDIVCLGIIAISFIKGVRFFYRNKYLGWLVAWIFATFIFNFYFPITTKGGFNIWVMEPMVHTLLAIVATFICISTLEEEDYKKIARTLCWSAICVSIFCIMQIIGLDPLGKAGIHKSDNHFSAFLCNPTVAGDYLCLIAPLFFIFIKDKRYLIGYIIVSLSVILSKSDLAILVWLLGNFLYFIINNFNNKKKIIVVVLSLIILLSGFSFYQIKRLKKDSMPITINNLTSRRGFIWIKSVDRLKDNPLFGQGLGVYKTFQIKDGPTNIREAHNDWLERCIDLGFVGIFLMALVIINSIRNFKFNNKISNCYFITFMSFLLLMCGAFVMSLSPLNLIGLISFWVIEGKHR